MKNQVKQWRFEKRPSRPALTSAEARYWRGAFKKLLKAGIEVEYNLKSNKGTCTKANFLCPCVASYEVSKPMPKTTHCFEQCARCAPGTTPEESCSIAKEHGCAGITCVAFSSPCPKCSKYDRGCATCERLYDIRKDPKHIRKTIGEALKPTRFVGEHGQTGVYKVCRDGSLAGKGGIEVATVGKRVQFSSLYAMTKDIMDRCLEHGAYTDERCSTHVHLLASYLTPSFDGNDRGTEYLKIDITELERPLPEIVLANFHQLYRRFHSAIIWLSIAGTHKDTLTRWEKFRKPILKYSALRTHMASVVNEVAGASKHKPKYSIVNYQQMKFDGKGNVTRFHLEARHMDGMLSPAAVTAHACLMYALVLKAVEVSRHGILRSGDKEYMMQQREILSCLCNNDGDWGGHRHSTTENLDPHIPTLVEQSQQLLRLLKTQLADVRPAGDILELLAKKPIAYRLIEGKSWAEIEKELYPEPKKVSPAADEILRLVDISAVTECLDGDEWVEAVAEELSLGAWAGKPVAEVKNLVKDFVKSEQQEHSLLWSASVGGYIRN